tara:strand:- start:131 stop:550 length:420 start_codon:yes stop_codon:yes gene_type:complete
MKTINKTYYIEIVNYPFGIEGFAEVKPYKSYGNNLKEAQNDFEEYCLFNENVRESAIQLYEYDEELDMDTLIKSYCSNLKEDTKHIYNIYWTDSYGNKDFVASTYDVNKWLEENNKQRMADGSEPESITEFQIEKRIIT